MRALVIDDSRAVRIIIRNILRELGMEVLEAGDGREALEQLRQNPDVELVLVDWNMPEMNGLEFIRAMRGQPVYNAVRILMVTTETESEQVALAHERRGQRVSHEALHQGCAGGQTQPA